MPNHVHVILIINPKQKMYPFVGTGRDLSLQVKIKSLSEIIGAFKTTSSKFIHINDCTEFRWQRSFYDHIIRNEISCNKIREYIQNNPMRWEFDKNSEDQIEL